MSLDMRISVPKVKVLRGTLPAMKLQKQLSRRYGGKSYPKWVLVLPPKTVEKLSWDEGLRLEAEVIGRRLIIKPTKLHE